MTAVGVDGSAASGHAAYRAAQPAPSPSLTWLGTLAQVLARGLLVGVSTLLFWSMAPGLMGWSSEIVVSGSMLPRIVPGDVVVAQPVSADKLVPGQVILVSNPARPGTLLMHRLISRYPDGSLKTRGDANHDADSTPVPVSMVRGLPRLRIPYVGLPMLWLRERQYSLVMFAAVMLLGAIVFSVGGPKDASTSGDAADDDRPPRLEPT